MSMMILQSPQSFTEQEEEEDPDASYPDRPFRRSADLRLALVLFEP